jgi:predicted enzyme related to lactoylglutathione lyase
MAELNVSGLMIGSEHAEALGEFYTGVLGRPADMNDGGFFGWQVAGLWFSVGPHSEVKGKAAEPQRVILNLEAADVRAEFDRIKGSGATVVADPYDLEGMTIATFADPDGNYFQLMSPWPETSES